MPAPRLASFPDPACHHLASLRRASGVLLLPGVCVVRLPGWSARYVPGDVHRARGENWTLRGAAAVDGAGDRRGRRRPRLGLLLLRRRGPRALRTRAGRLHFGFRGRVGAATAALTLRALSRRTCE